MKEFVSLIFTSCLLGLLLTGCKKEEPHECITKYIFQNDTELPVTMTCYKAITPETYKTIPILIEPGEEYVELYETQGFLEPFFRYYKVIVDNTKTNIEYLYTLPLKGIFTADEYTMILDEKYEQHYLFVFTDDFFAEIESEK